MPAVAWQTSSICKGRIESIKVPVNRRFFRLLTIFHPGRRFGRGEFSLPVRSGRHAFNALEDSDKSFRGKKSHPGADILNFLFRLRNKEFFCAIDPEHRQVIDVVRAGSLFKIGAEIIGMKVEGFSETV